MRLTWRTLAWGLCGSLVLLAVWFRPDPPGVAWAQFVRTNCSALATTNLTNGDLCADSTLQGLKIWNTTTATFSTISFTNGNNQATLSGANNALTFLGSAGNGAIIFPDPVAGNSNPIVWKAAALPQILANSAGTGVTMSLSTGAPIISILRRDIGSGTREIGRITYEGADSLGGAFRPGLLIATQTDNTSGAAGGFLGIQTLYSGVTTERMRIASGVSINTATEFGPGTLNVASATYANGLAAQVASATGVNLMSVRGISATQTAANNLRGTCTFSASNTCSVGFASNEPDASYFIATGCPILVGAKTVSGFTMTATTSNSNACDWILLH